MLAVVKTHRTDLRIQGFIPTPVLRILRHEFGKKLMVKSNDADDTLENVFESSEYKEFKRRVTPGDYVRTYRENKQMTQQDLGEKLGASRAYICDIEHNRRAISKEFAKKLSNFFQISVSRFI
jgi:DNA-binding XRE family transcriptional regulator